MGLEKFDEMARLVDEARDHYQQLVGGKQIAGTRARKALQAIKRIAQECRTAIQEIRTGKKDQSSNPS